METQQQHYKELNDAEEMPNINEYETDMNDTVTNGEVAAKRNKLKNRKSPGPDDISNELLKFGDTEGNYRNYSTKS